MSAIKNSPEPTTTDVDVVWEPPGPGTWQRDPSKQPKPMTGFLREVLPTRLNLAFAEAASRYGLLLDGFHMADVNGWLYLRPKPVGAPDKTGPPPPPWVIRALLLVVPALRARRRSATRALASRQWLADGRHWLDGGREAFVIRLRRLTADEPSTLARDDLVRHINELVATLEEGLAIHFRDAVGHFIAVGDFAQHVADWTGVPAQEAVTVLAGSSSSSVTPLDHLDSIGRALEATPEARQRVLSPELPPDERLATIRSASAEAAAALDAYLEEYGHRIIFGFDLDGKSLSEVPGALVAAIASRLGRPVPRPATTPDELRNRVPTEHLAEYDTLKAEAATLYGLRESDVGPTFEWPMGLLRRALRAAGAILAEGRRLQHPDHIFDATPTEIEALLRGDPAAPSPNTLAQRRFRRTSAPADPPLSLGEPSGPPSFDGLTGAVGRINRALVLGMGFDTGEDAKVRVQSSTELTGVAASRGVYRGRACVVNDAADFGRLVQGDVLVARTTTPTYNVVLPLLGAVVTDTGGVLSHAAIVAREYGIPAVVATGTATSSIVDGSLVTVDGDRGLVTTEG
jgi:pyruvate,water dikinase